MQVRPLPTARNLLGRNVSRSKTRDVPLHVRMKREKACDLRLAGMAYGAIATTVGYSNASHARAAVMAAIRTRVSESARQVRDMELARLDQMLMALWPAVRRGDPRATDSALKVMERRARLLGLDSQRTGVVTEQEDSPIDELAARRAARRSTATG